MHDYGLGGLLGDAALGALLSLLPLDPPQALRIVAPALAAAFVASTAYALGVTWAEAPGFLRFLAQGSVVLYSGAHGLTGRAVTAAAGGARAARDIAAEARARRAAAQLAAAARDRRPPLRPRRCRAPPKKA